MEKVYLIDCIYEREKQRVVSYFSKDPYSQKIDFVFKEKFSPYFYIDIPKDLSIKLLYDFKKEIKIERADGKLKITAKDKETLDKVYKIISFSTSKNILLIDVERQYLIEKEWGYYDIFIVVSRSKIKKIENYNISSVVKKYISPFLKEEQIKLIENITRKILLSNILKKKVDKNIKEDQIMNTFFENMFFKNKLVLNNYSKIEYLKKEKKIKNGIEISFSNIWPYLLTKEFYNIGNETMNCSCCKPKKYLDINVLSSSRIKVKFLKNGFYFLTKNKEWASSFHKSHENKENRLDFMRSNGLKEIPIGPFYNNSSEEILLVDAFKLIENKEVEIIEENKLNWFCLKEESYISKSIKENLKRLKNIEKSINLSTSITYGKTFKNNLEKSPLFILYLTEYKLINDLIEKIPNFLEHKNTKFYDPLISESIKHIKLETVERIDIDNNNNFLIENEKVIVKENSFLEKVNSYFPEINLPVPKLIIG